MKRLFSAVAVILATLVALLAFVLTRPNDLVEFIVGFVGGSVSLLQLALSLIAVALGGASLWIDRPGPRWTRVARISAVTFIAVAIVGGVWRENGDYSRQTVRFSVDGTERAGTLYRPRKAAGAQPAIVMLHGSGDIPRGGYHFVARRFAQHGFVALIFDKRGVGDSPGRYYGDDLDDGTVIATRAVEAAAALTFLASTSGVDRERVGVVTMSQGGWVMSTLLDGSSAASYAINLSGPAVSTHEESMWSQWTEENKDHFGMKPPPIPFEELDRRMRDIKPSGFDPRKPLATMTKPSLWLFGEWDSSQPVTGSIVVLDSLAAQGKPITWRLFKEANHGLFVVRGPNGRRLSRFAPGVWDTVFAWTDRQRITHR